MGRQSLLKCPNIEKKQGFTDEQPFLQHLVKGPYSECWSSVAILLISVHRTGVEITYVRALNAELNHLDSYELMRTFHLKNVEGREMLPNTLQDHSSPHTTFKIAQFSRPPKILQVSPQFQSPIEHT